MGLTYDAKLSLGSRNPDYDPAGTTSQPLHVERGWATLSESVTESSPFEKFPSFAAVRSWRVTHFRRNRSRECPLTFLRGLIVRGKG
jgi:hypothetical protein